MQNLNYVITGFGAIVVGVIDASPLWIIILASFSFFSTLLNPALSGIMENQIDKTTDKEVLYKATKTFISTYIFVVFLVSLYYGVGLIIGWLIN